MSLSPGTRLGVYEIVGLIGAGGMGEVHRARDINSTARSPSRFCRRSSLTTLIVALASSVKHGPSPR